MTDSFAFWLSVGLFVLVHFSRSLTWHCSVVLYQVDLPLVEAHGNKMETVVVVLNFPRIVPYSPLPQGERKRIFEFACYCVSLIAAMDGCPLISHYALASSLCSLKRASMSNEKDQENRYWHGHCSLICSIDSLANSSPVITLRPRTTATTRVFTVDHISNLLTRVTTESETSSSQSNPDISLPCLNIVNRPPRIPTGALMSRFQSIGRSFESVSHIRVTKAVE